MNKFDEINNNALQTITGGSWINKAGSAISSAYHQFSKGIYDGWHHKN